MEEYRILNCFSVSDGVFSDQDMRSSVQSHIDMLLELEQRIPTTGVKHTKKCRRTVRGYGSKCHEITPDFQAPSMLAEPLLE